MNKETVKYSHCFPANRERSLVSIIAYCGHFDDKEELFNEPNGGAACPICLKMHILRDELDGDEEKALASSPVP